MPSVTYPRLQRGAYNMAVERNAFVLPVSREGEIVDARTLVEREKAMKGISFVFLTAAGIGLFFQYRRHLTGGPSEPVEQKVV